MPTPKGYLSDDQSLRQRGKSIMQDYFQYTLKEELHSATGDSDCSELSDTSTENSNLANKVNKDPIELYRIRILEERGSWSDPEGLNAVSSKYGYKPPRDPKKHAKQQRLKTYDGDSDFHDPELLEKRAELRLKLKRKFEAIMEKYGQDFDSEADIVDLESGELIVDKGFLRKSDGMAFGSIEGFVSASDSDDLDSNETESEQSDVDYHQVILPQKKVPSHETTEYGVESGEDEYLCDKKFKRVN